MVNNQESRRRLAARVTMMPRDSDEHGKISGGAILGQIDLAASVVARSACRNQRIGQMVTRAMDSIDFKQPVEVGDVLTCYGSIFRVGTTSVSVRVEVFADRQGKVLPVTEATAVFVALGEDGRPAPVCGKKPASRATSNTAGATEGRRPAGVSQILADDGESQSASSAGCSRDRERVLAVRKVMMPNETNARGSIFGGTLLGYMDQAGAYAASRVCNNRVIQRCVIRHMDRVEFRHAVHVGDIITCYGTVTHVGRTSIGVRVEVEAERPGETLLVTQADLVFVAVDAKGRAAEVSCRRGGKGRFGRKARGSRKQRGDDERGEDCRCG